MTRLPGLEASTGSLGQGLAVGLGIALGARLRGLGVHTFVMLGDGETQEGMVWESVMVAARYGLGNLTAIVDCNGLQQYGWPPAPGEDARGDRRDPLGRDAVCATRSRPSAGGSWRSTATTSTAIVGGLCGRPRRPRTGRRPTAILAETVKGRGLSFTEGRFEWHARVATADEVAAARLELGLEPTDAGRVTAADARRVGRDPGRAGRRRTPTCSSSTATSATSTRADRFAAAHPDRFLQMGIAEQNMVGVAAGLATLGYVPWLSSFAVFLTHRAVDQVRMLVAQTHANVKIGAAYTGLLTGFTGKTHQDVEDLAIMRAMPGMTVLAPGDATECAAAGPLGDRDPGAGLPPPGSRRRARTCSTPGYRFEPGRVIRLRAGSDVLIVSTGLQIGALPRRGRDPRGRRDLGRRPPRPVASSRSTRRRSPRRRRGVRLVVSVEEHTILGGLGGLVAEILGEREPRRLVRIGIQDTWGESAPNAFLLDRHGLSPERVAERVALRAVQVRAVEVHGSMIGRRPRDRGDRHERIQGEGPEQHRRRVPRRRPDRARTHLQTLAGIRNARIVVVADPDPRGSRARSGDVARAGRATADALDAINDPAVEVVVIATPTSTHASLIEAALRAGKAIWSEKPIALDLAETNRVVDALARDGPPRPARVHAPVRPGLRPGQGADRRRRARAGSSSSGPTRAIRTRRRSSSSATAAARSST